MVPLHYPEMFVLYDLQDASSPTCNDTILHCDNVGAIKLMKNPIFHAKTKRIEIDHHFVHERVLQGEIRLTYISTNDQPIDLFTKPLGCIKFSQHRDAIGIISRRSLNLWKICSLFFCIDAYIRGIANSTLLYPLPQAPHTRLDTLSLAIQFACLNLMNCWMKIFASIWVANDYALFALNPIIFLLHSSSIIYTPGHRPIPTA